MRIIKTLATGFMIMVCIAGCSKKSALEGKLVDGKGDPLVGIKMFAKQKQPIKGFEQFETTTEQTAASNLIIFSLIPNTIYLPTQTDTLIIVFGTR